METKLSVLHIIILHTTAIITEIRFGNVGDIRVSQHDNGFALRRHNYFVCNIVDDLKGVDRMRNVL